MSRLSETKPLTHQQIEAWRLYCIEWQKRAGEFNEPNPLLDRIKALEEKLAAIEQFLVI